MKNPLAETILSHAWWTPSTIRALKSWTHPHPCLYKCPLGHLTALTTAIQIFTNTVIRLHWGIRPERWLRACRCGGNAGQRWQTAVEGGTASFLVPGQTPAKSHHGPKSCLCCPGKCTDSEIIETRGLDESFHFGWTVDLDSTKPHLPDLIFFIYFIFFPCCVLRELLKWIISHNKLWDA